MRIDIGSDTSPFQVEQDLLRAVSQTGFEVRLARHLGSRIFSVASVCTLLATLAKRDLKVIDWGKRSPGDLARFEHTLEGLAAIVHAARIVTEDNNPYAIDKVRTILGLSSRLGIADNVRSSDGESPREQHRVSFVACDPLLPDLPALPPIDINRDSWINGLISYRKKYTLSSDLAAERFVAEFIYEIYQNTVQHGNMDADGRGINGVRYIAIRRHMANSISDLTNRVADFPGLQDYLRSRPSTRGPARFCEICIGDNGLGIVGQYVATKQKRGETLAPPADEAAFINHIIMQHLSRKVGQPGAGKGLGRALEAVKKVQGFISFRTGSQWLTYSAEREHVILTSVSGTGPLADARGTTVCLLYPLQA
jgi:hypothetical protein